MDSSILRAPRNYGNLTITRTSLLRTLRNYRNLSFTDTSLIRTPRYYGHRTITDSSLFHTPHFYGHLTITDTSLLRTEAAKSFDFRLLRAYGNIYISPQILELTVLTLVTVKTPSGPRVNFLYGKISLKGLAQPISCLYSKTDCRTNYFTIENISTDWLMVVSRL